MARSTKRGDGNVVQWFALGISIMALVSSIFLPRIQSYLFSPRGTIEGERSISIEGRAVEFRGTAANIAPDHRVWLLIKPVDDLKHYAVPVDWSDGEWESGPTVLGEDKATPGAAFWVYLYDIDSVGNVQLEAATAEDIPDVSTVPPGNTYLASTYVTRTS